MYFKLLIVGGVALTSYVTKHFGLDCWMPEMQTISSCVDAGVNFDFPRLATLVSGQVRNSASLCWHGLPTDAKLFQAAKKGDSDTAVALFETPNKKAGAPSELALATNAFSETALHVAAANGQVAIVKLLLEQGAQVNAKDKNGNTPLINASLNGHDEVVDLLLSAGADVDIQSLNGSTAIMFAAWAGHTDIAVKLIQKHCALDLQKEDGFTALMLASRNGRISVVKPLLEAGANVNLAKKDGWTALILATFNGRSSIAKLLIEYGADSEAKDADGFNAEHYAQKQGYFGMKNVLAAALQTFEFQKTKADRIEAFKENLGSLLVNLAQDEGAAYYRELVAIAQQAPKGTYQESCVDITLIEEGKILTAKCKNQSEYEFSSLRLPCPHKIENIEGKLICLSKEETELRDFDGPYKQSCTGCHVSAGALWCSCVSYQWTFLNPETQLTKLTLPCKGKIENRHGELKCE